MKKQTRRLKNRARTTFVQVCTTIAATLSQLLSATAPFGVTMRLRLATPTGLAASLSHSLTAPTPFGVTMRLRLATPTGLAATLSQLLSATAPIGALGAVEKKCYAGIFESSG